MAGILVPFLPKTTFDFSFLTAGSKTIVLHPALNVTGYYYARLIVRVHEIDINTTGGTAKIEIGAYSTNPSSEDPRDFAITTTPLPLLATINTQTAGALVTDTETDIYPFFKMFATGTQGTSPSARVFAVLSADLLLREA
jgi:hypothetical protein